MLETYLDHTRQYIIGVSGGSDSMALLDMMVSEGYKVGVAHVNYNLRHDTEEDYAVVHDYCQKHNIPFFYKEFSQEDYKKGNFQAAARDMRYAFYKECLSKGYDAVVLAHHKDDIIETIYMYLERGSKTHYLGIEEKTTVKGMTIIRPLLDMHKSEIQQYCIDHHIQWHDDYTNFQTHFKRDQVRNLVLPDMSEEDKEALLKKAELINKETSEKEARCQKYIDEYKKNNSIDYHHIPSDLLETFFFLLLEEVMPVQVISESLIKEIISQMNSDLPNITLSLPIHHLFIKEYDNIHITKEKDVKDYSYSFSSIEEFECEYFRLELTGEMNDGVPVSEEDFPLTVRNIRAGDVIKTPGGTKKVSRLFINNKIPSNLRKKYPILVRNDGEILLVPSLAKRIGYMATNPNVFVLK